MCYVLFNLKRLNGVSIASKQSRQYSHNCKSNLSISRVFVSVLPVRVRQAPGVRVQARDCLEQRHVHLWLAWELQTTRL